MLELEIYTRPILAELETDLQKLKPAALALPEDERARALRMSYCAASTAMPTTPWSPHGRQSSRSTSRRYANSAQSSWLWTMSTSMSNSA